eukprot:37576-Prorocentrum_minimum.AAC.1
MRVTHASHVCCIATRTSHRSPGEDPRFVRCAQHLTPAFDCAQWLPTVGHPQTDEDLIVRMAT